MKETVINSKQALEDYKRFLDAQFEQHKYLRVMAKTGKQRSSSQNASLHLYCGMLAEALNDAGLDFRTFHKEGYDVPWTMDLVKDHVWRPIQKVMTGKESTTKPERSEYIQIFEVLNRKLSELGIYVPWPCKDEE